MILPTPILSSRCLIAAALGMLLTFTGCESSDKEDSSTKALPVLQINRSPTANLRWPLGHSQRASNWEARAAAGQPYLVYYSCPYAIATLYSTLDSLADSPVDPFSTSPSDKKLEFRIFQEVLEDVGVVFEDATWAILEAEREVLAVYQNDDQHELIDAYFQSIHSTMESVMHCQFDIFEVTAADASIVLGTPGEAEKYQLLLGWMESGRARFSNAASIPARSGQRSKSESVIELTTMTPDVPEPSPKQVGLSIEVDPILDRSGKLVELVAKLSTTEFPGENSPPARETDLFALPAPSNFSTEVEMPTDQVQLLGVLATASDIAATEPVAATPDDPVLLPFVRISNPNIEPESPEKSASTFARESSNPYDTRTRIYHISRAQWESMGEHLYGRGQSPTVFSNPVALGLIPNPKPELSLAAALNLLGFKIQSGSQVVYNADSETLIASLNAFEMNRLELLFRDFEQRTMTAPNIALQLEIFELPAQLCRQLGESAALGANHAPEWKAVTELVEEGSATIVTGLVSIGRNGQRGKIEDIHERSFFPHYAHRMGNDDAEPVIEFRPHLEEYAIGTILEYDAVLYLDGLTVDCNLALDHHTAAPDQISRTLRFPDSQGGRVTEVSVPVFHRHRTYTQVAMALGSTHLLAMWRPTGEPRFRDGDLMQIAFLRAHAERNQQIERIH